MIGSVVAGHRIVRLVGRGGMGVVYEAVEEALGRTVALKLVAPERTGEHGFRERFITESRLAASIDHPNVLPVFGAGEHEGTLYLAMRFVDGDDLRTVVERDGPLAPARAAAIVAQVGAALDAAHALRLVHRDVKPANILLARGDHAYLTDFGLVKGIDETTGQTRTGEVVGTLDYVAPERIRGDPVGPWSDLYSLGCVLYFALTGEVVFGLDVAERKLWAHLSEPPPAVAAAPAFDAVVARALAKDPHRRYESGAALGAAALAAAGGERPPARILDSARRSERAIRAAAPGSDVAAAAADFLAGLERAAERAALLRAALEDTPPEQIERRLVEVRAGQDPGKARMVAALARHLAVQRRMRAALHAFDAESERLLLELETVRGRVLADDPAAGERLGALQDELATLADQISGAKPAT